VVYRVHAKVSGSNNTNSIVTIRILMAGLKALIVIAQPVPANCDYFIDSSLSALSLPSQPHNGISRGQNHIICIRKHITKPLKPLVRCTGHRASEQPAGEETEAAIEAKAAQNPHVQSKILRLASEEAVEGPEILHAEAREEAEEIASEIGESVEKTAELLEKKVEEVTQKAAASISAETLRRT